MQDKIVDVEDKMSQVEHDIKLLRFQIKMKEKEMNIMKLKKNEIERSKNPWSVSPPKINTEPIQMPKRMLSIKYGEELKVWMPNWFWKKKSSV